MSEVMTYAGLCPGCERALILTVDAPDRRESVAEDVAEIIRASLVLRHITVEEARGIPFGCRCPKAHADGQVPLFAEETAP